MTSARSPLVTWTLLMRSWYLSRYFKPVLELLAETTTKGCRPAFYRVKRPRYLQTAVLHVVVEAIAEERLNSATEAVMLIWKKIQNDKRMTSVCQLGNSLQKKFERKTWYKNISFEEKWALWWWVKNSMRFQWKRWAVDKNHAALCLILNKGVICLISTDQSTFKYEKAL